MNKIRVVILATILATVAAAGASLLLPVAADWHNGWALYHLRVAIALCIPAMHIIAALFFLLGLQGFKQELRRAYILVATSIVLFGLCLLSSPAVTLLNLWDTWVMLYGVPNVPFLAPVLVLTLALTVFFQSLNITSLWRKLWFNLVVIAGFIIVVVFSPHATSPLSEFTYDFGNAMFALSSVILMTLGIKMLVIRRHLTESYAKVITWLAVGVIAESILVGSSIIVKGIGLDPRSLANLQDVLLLAVVPFMVSGYSFYQLTSDTRSVAAERNATAIDVVVYVASLASNIEEIDPILDGLRGVTSELQSGASLSVENQQRLAKVYLQLETYLERRETYRAFTKKQLRDLIYQKFNSSSFPSPDTAFWQQVPAMS